MEDRSKDFGVDFKNLNAIFLHLYRLRKRVLWNLIKAST